MRVVLRGRRSWLLWSATLLGVVAISLSALTVVFGSPLPSAIRAGLAAGRAAEAEQIVSSYRAGETAALLTLSDDVLAQLPLFATGAALDGLMSRVAALRAGGNYQKLEIASREVVQVLEDDAYRYVMTNEVITLTTYPQAPGDGAAIARNVASWQVVYTLIQEAGRWKVAKVVAVEH